MKKYLLIIATLLVFTNSYSQNCEEREDKLLSAVGGFSAGLLYNTYGLIGSVADAFGKDAYTAETVTDLMNAQKNMADNLIKLIDGLVKDNALKDENDKNYIIATKEVIAGLKKQAEILADYAKTNSSQQQKAYEQQRQKNWKDISKLMGIEE
jgi:hypothetical protein